MQQHIPHETLGPIVLDFARLLPQAALRIPLLTMHYAYLEQHNQRQQQQQHSRNQGEERGQSYSSLASPLDASTAGAYGTVSCWLLTGVDYVLTNDDAATDDGYDSDDDHVEDLPTTVCKLPT